MSNQPTIWQARVYYEDTDAGGVVFYARYLAFYERARTELLREKGFSQQQLLQQHIAFVVKHVSIDYLRPAVLDDLLTIQTTIRAVKRVSLTFEQQIVNQHNDVINKATTQVACVNIKKMKPEPLTAQMLMLFSSLENL